MSPQGGTSPRPQNKKPPAGAEEEALEAGDYLGHEPEVYYYVIIFIIIVIVIIRSNNNNSALHLARQFSAAVASSD